MYETLLEDLRSEGLAGLLVVADTAGDSDLAPFVGAAHLRASLLTAHPRKGLKLGYWSPMEREEAAATGLEPLTPEALDLPRWDRTLEDPARHLAAVLGQALLLSEIAPGKVALAGHAGVGRIIEACRHLEAEGFSFVSGHALVARWRKRKTGPQLAEIRRAAQAANRAFRRVAVLLAAAGGPAVTGSSVASTPRELTLEGSPLTVGRLRREIARILADDGFDQPDGNIVAPAEEAAVPHNAGCDDRPLRLGEGIIVDLYPKGLLYADCTRTFCVGEPPPALAAAHVAVLEALSHAHREVRPGLRGWDLQRQVCERLAGRGYATPITHPGTIEGYVHNLGHGVGFELHELPSFKETAGEREGRLEVGDVLTLEPGLYDPEAGWGVRLEDLVFLGPEGPENLTPLPYDLDPAAWLI